jgi:3-oxoacyl-[acyl-carrier-protein] synthase-3
VGGTHRKLMLQSLGLPEDRDYVTYPWLGNTGSVALPVTLAVALESGFIRLHEQVALLGIGSGINSIMLAASGAGFQPARPHVDFARVSPAASPA